MRARSLIVTCLFLTGCNMPRNSSAVMARLNGQPLRAATHTLTPVGKTPEDLLELYKKIAYFQDYHSTHGGHPNPTQEDLNHMLPADRVFWVDPDVIVSIIRRDPKYDSYEVTIQDGPHSGESGWVGPSDIHY